MKYFLLMLVTLMGWEAMAQSPVEAASYNDEILRSQRGTSRKSMRYLKVALYSDNVARIERKRKEVLAELKKAKKKTEGIDSYYGDNSLKGAMLAYLEVSIANYDGSFKAANDLWEEKNKSYLNLKRYYEVLEKGEEAMDKASDAFNKEQNAFAEKNGVTILDDDGLAKQVELFDQANDFSRKIELIHFRTYAMFNKYLESMNEGKYKNLETIRQELLKAVKQSSDELEALPVFKGDGEVRLRVKESLRYYEGLGNNEFKKTAEILGKKGANLSQSEANEVNKAMQSINKTSPNVYNKYFEALRALLRKYIPEED